MLTGILNETEDQRVAIVPEGAAKLAAMGLTVAIEKGAGVSASFPDEMYAAHARILERDELLRESDILISIHPPTAEDLGKVKKGALLISMFQPFADPDVVQRLSQYGVSAFSMDMIPRTTLAQSMDVLSSMASIAGYQAVLEAARYLPRYFPMMITAAGSLKPAKVLVLGAGVAGLQAIATARRLGAIVEAFDTRSAAKEEVLSLGARFIEVEGAREDKGAGGYAIEQSEDFLKRQREEVKSRAEKSDIIITTAQVRGRKAPTLVTRDTVENMRPGSVVVDLAASTGGNCELTQDNAVIVHKGVTIVGNSNLATLLPQDASFLFNNNVLNFMKLFIKEGRVVLDKQNEIISQSLIIEAS